MKQLVYPTHNVSRFGDPERYSLIEKRIGEGNESNGFTIEAISRRSNVMSNAMDGAAKLQERDFSMT